MKTSPGFNELKQEREGKCAKSEQFPSKLYEILSTHRFKEVIAFADDGKSWRVIDKERLERDVLPKYFRTGKYLSFTRNVLGWGFERKGKAKYFHKFFCRDNPDNIGLILRISASKLKSMNMEGDPSNSLANLRLLSKQSRLRSKPRLSIMHNFPSENVPFSSYNNQARNNASDYPSQIQTLHTQNSISSLPVYTSNTFTPAISNSVNMIPQASFVSTYNQEEALREENAIFLPTSCHDHEYLQDIGCSYDGSFLNQNKRHFYCCTK